MNLRQWYEWAGKIRALLFVISVLVVIATILYNPPHYISEAPLIISFKGLLFLDFIKMLFGSAMLAECLRIVFHRRTSAWTSMKHFLVGLVLIVLHISVFYSFGSPGRSRRYYDFAWTMNQQKDYSRAVQVLDISLSYNPRNTSAHHERGYAHKQLGAFDEALKDYARAISIDPTDPDVHEGMGQVYYSMRDYKNALSHLHTAMSLDPTRSVRLDQWIKAAEQGAANQAL